MKRGFWLVGLWVVLLVGGVKPIAAQLGTTTVADTVYRADGTAAAGSVVVSWGAFTTANGIAVAAGTTSVTLGSGGALSIALAPNAGATPMGTYYTAVFHLDDGTTSRQYWSVPVTLAGGGPTKLAAISTQVLPASVAMQTVSKQYVDNEIARAQIGLEPLDASPFVLKAGDTMTGPLVLPGDPVTPQQAADMHYVDASVAAVAAGLGGKVALLPSGSQVVSQPAGTQLEANDVNGELYATQYLSGMGNNGIANAAASTNCASGCEIKVEQTYPGTDVAGPLPQATQVEDARGGSRSESSTDPLNYGGGGASTTLSLRNQAVRSAAALSTQMPGATPTSYTLSASNQAQAGGSNQFPEGIESVPYFKSTYGVSQMVGNYNTQGQHVQMGSAINCYGVGDCLAGSQFILSEGGYRDSADEGTHPFDLNVAEDSATFTGTCATGCTAGSTSVKVTPITGIGTQGDGRYLIDKNPVKVISTGTLVSGGASTFATANFTGTSFPVSVFLATAGAATSQAHNLAPGTVTLAIATSGAPTGFATNTAALPATSGVACVADPGGLPNYEQANYTVVDGTHAQLTLNKVHAGGATIAVGGLCGYGLEETVDTLGAVRQVFPVMGSTSATRLFYAGASTPIVGVSGLQGAFLNDTFTVASISRTANVVTVTAAASFADDVNGLSMTVNGVADSSYNGTYVVTTTSANTLTYANTGVNSTSSGGTVSVVTGGFALYPMAEVLSVYDPAAKGVDGLMTLGANTVAWATGDAVEEPHFYQQRTAADVEFITQYVPRPNTRQSAGKYYGGVVGPQMIGWEVGNTEPASDYIGSGGTHSLPTDAFSVQGVWANDFEVVAGEDAVIRVHCNAKTCGRWDSGYALWALNTNTGADSESFAPQSDTVTWTMGGTQYSFSPTSFTAGTINVGTLNATTITGGVAASAITSGTIAPARLPVFGPSGTSHAVGAVPDPGATAGATRFLREDGTWSAVAGSGGGTVTSFAAPSASWPSWLAPTVTNATTTPSLGVALSGTIPVAAIATTGGAAAIPTSTATATANDLVMASASFGLSDSTLGMLTTGSGTTLSTYIKAPGSTQPSYFGTTVQAQTLMGSNCYFNGTNWVYATTGFCSAFRLNSSGSPSAVEGVEINITPSGTAGATIGALDTTYVGLVGLPSAINKPQWVFDPGSVSPTSGAVAVVTVNPDITADALAEVQINASIAITHKNLVLQEILNQTGDALEVQSSTGAVLAKVSSAGVLTTPQVVGGGSAPTMAAGAAAGTLPSCTTVAGSNLAGVVTCTTGTATVANATLATVTFSGTMGTAPEGCSLMPRNAAAAGVVGTVYTTSPTTGSWAIGVGATAVGASTAYSWSYNCM